MTPAETHCGTQRLESLRQRLAEAGVGLLACDAAGSLQPLDNAPAPLDWLTTLLERSPLITRAVAHAAEEWGRCDEPRPAAIAPGLWAVPIPMAARRRRTGYHVAVIVTPPFLDSEQLVAVCQSGAADLQSCRDRLRRLPPVAEAEVPRIATLVRSGLRDQAELISGAAAMESVGRQLAESYEEMNLLYTIIQNMTVRERPERFVATACQELRKTLPYAWIGMQFGDDRARLKSLAGRLIIAGDSGQPSSLLRHAARTLLGAAQPGEPIVLDPQRNPSHASLSVLGASALAQPVQGSGQVLGLLIAGSKRGPDTAASSVDLKLLGATATNLAIFLENAALYDDLNAMFLGTLEALTASIDAKDRYTCGHSRRVAHLTRQLAQAIGLDEHTCERMHIAGLVHDVGKIGVPEAVLLKPGRLTHDEFEWIRRHPEMGYRILKDIPQLNDILPGVLHHHERWDGRGYPEGIAGEAIPLVARLIGLADSFDAMSSNRTYRSALSRPQVLDEITACAGVQFDPQLAAVFVKLDFSHFDQLVREHQASDLQPSMRLREEAA